LRSSFGNCQLADPMNKQQQQSNSRDRLDLDLSANCSRSRIVSLTDLALDALSPVVFSAAPSRNAADLTTPTPTQFLFPKSVTAEQEDYASGFARALEEIYRTQGRPDVAGVVADDAQVCPGTLPAPVAPPLTPRKPPVAGNCGVWQPTSSTLHYIPQSASSSSSSPSPPTFHQLAKAPPVFQPAPLVSFPAVSSSFTGFPPSTTGSSSCMYGTVNPVALPFSDADSSSSSPRPAVDMAEQDRWRLERKRAKNRVAAAKCQMRKLERIARLEDKVRDLRDYNARLSQTAVTLREQVSRLQRQITSHTERGCRLLVPSMQ